MLYSHIASPPVVAEFPAFVKRIVKLPQGPDIIVGIHARLLKEPHPLPFGSATPGLPSSSRSPEPVKLYAGRGAAKAEAADGTGLSGVDKQNTRSGSLTHLPGSSESIPTMLQAFGAMPSTGEKARGNAVPQSASSGKVPTFIPQWADDSDNDSDNEGEDEDEDKDVEGEHDDDEGDHDADEEGEHDVDEGEDDDDDEGVHDVDEGEYDVDEGEDDDDEGVHDVYEGEYDVGEGEYDVDEGEDDYDEGEHDVDQEEGDDDDEGEGNSYEDSEPEGEDNDYEDNEGQGNDYEDYGDDDDGNDYDGYGMSD